MPWGDILIPTFSEEELVRAEGYRCIAGLDEVGCGPLAGPVVAAAVVLPYPLEAPWLQQVRDSKLLTAARRENLAPLISEVAVSVGIGVVPAHTIDRQGLTRARRLAMKLAVERLMPPPDYLLIDYVRLPDVALPQKGVRNGDSLCFSIACASIVAKVTRDLMMVEMDKAYPGYGFARHKGYMCKEHISCLRRLGPCPIHRRSFQPVKNCSEIRDETT